MKLSDGGQTDWVLAHKDVWTLDDADEMSKPVCEFRKKRSFINKKDTRHPRRIERYVNRKNQVNEKGQGCNAMHLRWKPFPRRKTTG